MSRHQKRVTAPVSWPIARKTQAWVAKTSPGPHSAAESMPLVMVVRDMLKMVDNAREARRALYEGRVLVDGRAQKNYKLPVGIFDVITIPDLNQQYRMLKDEKGMFYLSLLEPGRVRKLARIENKTFIKGGKQQLNLSDGSNKLAEGDFNVGDSLVLSLPEKNIEERIGFEVGNLAMVVGGRHSGQTGKIKEIITVRSSQPNRVIISGEKEFETIKDYVYMIGKDAPVIKLGAVR
ncbi:MAG TPA: 30S ribosomal protein S4e [Methanothrix sp.]|mgnify:CR=1 FL=1|nr:30S ribosomal protein S4e [Methanothrix sp.]HOV81706.1 30S ribosomal protein S4e [Methanothrix sp.]HPC89835.1 30S ribosomal protein S4e [Methanothrix sp.]HQE88439.1 30S ribosomal protein S4e [Methanothrix sp.]HQI67654.1 30S ribosomal protein S4e [Methanothrix sp.]